MENAMKNQTSVLYNNTFIGDVYLSSHGVWIAEPSFSIYSKSFLTQEAAIVALIEKYKETI